MESVAAICGPDCPDWPRTDGHSPINQLPLASEFTGGDDDWLHVVHAGFAATFARRRRIGCQARDPDGKTLCEFCHERESIGAHLAQALAHGSYMRGPVRVVHRRKPTGGTRPICIPTYADRVLARGLLALLRPVQEGLCPGCVGGVSRSRISDVLREVQVAMRNGRAWTVSCDVRKFYDSIPHAPLSECLEEVLPEALLSTVLCLVQRADAADGILQGMPLSTLVGNLYLDPLDRRFYERDVECWRYVDDILLVARSDRAAARHRATLERTLGELGLGCKAAPQVVRVTRAHGVQWLGVEVRPSGARIPFGRLQLLERQLQLACRLRRRNSPHLDKVVSRLRSAVSHYLACGAAPAERLSRSLSCIAPGSPA